jgi:hypothetical protein
MTQRKQKNEPPPNPAGRKGKPLHIPLPFEDAVAAALETPLPEPDGKPLDRKGSRRYDRKKK